MSKAETHLTIVAKRQSDTIEKLIRDIREMDQLVYQMATAGTPGQMRSALQRAWAITEKRMHAESDAISTVLIGRIKEVYK